MGHHHHHDHHHGDIKSDLSFEEKIVKLLEHWIKHNKDHADTYMQWARKAKDHGMEEIGSLLDVAAQKTVSANEEFNTALKVLSS